MGKAYLTPAAVIVGLAGSGELALGESFRGLEGLRKYVREDVYEEARQMLEAEKKDTR